MNPPSCKTCRYFMDVAYCDRKVKVTGYNLIYGYDIVSNFVRCESERNGFTWFGLNDVCGKSGKYWEQVK